MDLSELAAYAEEKYHIEEQHKWADFPGFSVLNDPHTGKWAALLMRQWDHETGTELQRCDIKCGRQILNECKAPYLAPPFRMKGIRWVGVKFDETTEPELVYQLFDRAIEDGGRSAFEVREKERGAATIVLEELKGLKGFRGRGKIYEDTALPPEEERIFGAKQQIIQISGKKRIDSGEDDAVPGLPFHRNWYNNIPQKIREMMQLYRHGDGSFGNKCRNFYVQGKYMEDYEDNAPWTGECRRYFTTYHDLNANQLRGYFTWRAHVRKGEFRRIPTSLAYLYLYELLSGIGTTSVDDCLSKLKAFETGYLDSGIGDPAMRENLHRWMMEYAVIWGAPPEYVLAQVDDDILKRDDALLKLKDPQDRTDDELFTALSLVTGGKIETSPIITKEEERGKHLLSEVWRNLSENYDLDGWDIFTACFGKQKEFPWHPFANAVYYSERREEDREYVLNGCRKYVCRNGSWSEVRYDDLFFDKYRVHAVVHEANRLLRRYLKTGHYLRAKKGEEWITPYVEAVIEADKTAIIEAAKPKVTIDLSGLDKIRREAAVTRESLLTEEEILGMPIWQRPAAEELAPRDSQAEEIPAMRERKTVDEPASEIAGLNSIQTQILRAAMRGEPVADLISAHHLMPSVVTDAINEVLFDEIGDNVLECDGDKITLVEDYRMDLEDILGDI